MISVVLFLLFSLLNYNLGYAEDATKTYVDSFFTSHLHTDSDTKDVKKYIDASGGEPCKCIPYGGEPCKCIPYYLCNRTITSIDSEASTDNPCDSVSVCCRETERATQPLVPSFINKSPRKCGTHNPEGVGFQKFDAKNYETQFGEIPWVVAVIREETTNYSAKTLQYICSGALIHPQVVVTVAHCVRNKDGKYKIRAGEWDTQTTNELYPHQNRDVATVVIHPEFNNKLLNNDIAVLILEAPVEIGPNVDIVCLPKQGMIVDESKCFTSSWGKHNFGLEGTRGAILKKINMQLVSSKTCQDLLRTTRLGIKFNLHESFICAGDDLARNECDGDGGSPLVCPIAGHPGRYLQVGMLSWGIYCSPNPTPRVYVNMPKFSNWIDQELNRNNFSVSYYEY